MDSLGFLRDKKDIKIVVAMSGGVDSSVVAVMLKKQGYNVIGITLQLYDHGAAISNKKACCAGADIKDAKDVALEFGFPHYVLDYESIFKESVIDNFADSYIRGETPIPCVRCNQSVKFNDLFKVAKDLNADALATGHYVQRIVKDGEVQIFRGAEANKDQSYFLFATTKDQIDFLRFPLGGQTKEETRKLAHDFGIKIANKPDSQDICFVPGGDYKAVINKIRPSAFKTGNIVDIAGNILGQHEGIINYTIGQRRGLGQIKRITGEDPLYVVKIDAKNNQIIVGSEADLFNSKFLIKEVNWLGSDILNQEVEVSVKLRSAGEPQKAILKMIDESKAVIRMINPTRAITKGQACVIYEAERMLGGGWIDEIIEEN